MFGQRLKELRTNKGMSQAELASFLGVTQQAVGLYETSKRQPDQDTLKKLADFFNVSIDFLLGRISSSNLDSSTNKKIESALMDNPELLAFWEELKVREDLQLLLKQVRPLKPEGIKQIIRIIKAIKDENSQED